MLRINGELIDPSMVEEAFSRIKSEAEARLQVSCCERDPEFMKEAEEEVIDSILIAQEAESRYPTMPEAEVRDRLEEMVKAFRKHGASWEMLEAQRKQMHDECEANLRMEKFLDDILRDQPELTEEDLRAYYDEHQREFKTVAEVKVQHLMKLIEKHEDPVILLEEMREIREEAMVEGCDFGVLAERETEKDTGEIELDWITFDRPSNPIESIMFTMRLAEVSPVIAYEHAYHILKITGIKPSEVTPFEELREDLEQRVRFERRRQALRDFAGSLRGEATVERVDYSGDDEEEDEVASTTS